MLRRFPLSAAPDAIVEMAFWRRLHTQTFSNVDRASTSEMVPASRAFQLEAVLRTLGGSLGDQSYSQQRPTRRRGIARSLGQEGIQCVAWRDKFVIIRGITLPKANLVANLNRHEPRRNQNSDQIVVFACRPDRPLVAIDGSSLFPNKAFSKACGFIFVHETEHLAYCYHRRKIIRF